jgi:hypothetical protein
VIPGLCEPLEERARFIAAYSETQVSTQGLHLASAMGNPVGLNLHPVGAGAMSKECQS